MKVENESDCGISVCKKRAKEMGSNVKVSLAAVITSVNLDKGK